MHLCSPQAINRDWDTHAYALPHHSTIVCCISISLVACQIHESHFEWQRWKSRASWHEQDKNGDCEEGESSGQNEWGGESGNVRCIAAHQRPHDPPQGQERFRNAHHHPERIAVRKEPAAANISMLTSAACSHQAGMHAPDSVNVWQPTAPCFKKRAYQACQIDPKITLTKGQRGQHMLSNHTRLAIQDGLLHRLAILCCCMQVDRKQALHPVIMEKDEVSTAALPIPLTTRSSRQMAVNACAF
jgi:hypothetical protein